MRDARFDQMRVLGALAVICLHVSGPLLKAHPDVTSSLWFTADLFDAFTRWSVPVFVMVSGALLLAGDGPQGVADFYRRRALRLLPTLVFWSAFYLVANLALHKLTPADVGRVLLAGVPHYHLWYLYMLAGLLLAAPFLRRMVQSISPGALAFLVCFGLLAALAESARELLADGFGGCFLAMFPFFVPFFLAGVWLSKLKVPLSQPSLLGIALSCVLAEALATRLLFPLFGEGTMGLMWAYLNPFVAGMSLAVFALGLGSASPEGRWGAFVARFGPLTLGIYVIHPCWLTVLDRCGLNGFLLVPAVGIVVTTLAAFVLSALSALLLARVRILAPLVT